MKISLKFIVYTVFVLSFIECEYQPEGDFYKKIINNNTKKPTLSLRDCSNDTILIYETSFFSYAVNYDSLNIKYINIFLDSTLIDSVDSENEYFSINVNDFTDGFHVLTFQIITNTNSRSLADIMGFEDTSYFKSYTVGIEKSLTNCVQLKSVYKEEGHLKLEWYKYNGMFFDEYKLNRRQNGNDYSSTVGTFENIDQLSCYDDGYLGGNVFYTVYAKFRDNYSPMCGNIAFNDDYLHFYPIKVLNHEQVKVCWTKCRYEAAFTKCYLGHYNNSIGYGYTYYLETDNINDTIANAELFFGSPVRLTVTFNGKTESSYYDASLDYTAGKRFPEFSKIVSANDTNYVFQLNISELQQVSVVKGEIIQSSVIPSPLTELETNISISSDKKNILLYNSSQIFVFDANNFSIIDTIKITDYGFVSPDIDNVTIANSSQMLINFSDYNGGYVYGFLIYDLTDNDTVFSKYGKNENIHFGYFSPEGDYIIDAGRSTSTLYSFNGHTLTSEIGTVSANLNSTWTAFNYDKNEIYSLRSNYMFIYNLNDFSIKNTFEFNYKFLNYNPYLNLVCVKDLDYYKNRVYLVDLDNGEITDKISIAFDRVDYKFLYYSIGDNLLSSSGYKLNL